MQSEEPLLHRSVDFGYNDEETVATPSPHDAAVTNSTAVDMSSATAESKSRCSADSVSRDTASTGVDSDVGSNRHDQLCQQVEEMNVFYALCSLLLHLLLFSQ